MQSLLVRGALAMALVAVFAMGAAFEAQAKGKPGKGGTRYEIEFRSRNTDQFGHNYVVVRQRGAGGKVVSQRVAGFYPAEDAQPLDIIFGRAKGYVGTKKDDFVMGATARYVVPISAKQYQKAVNRIDSIAGKPQRFDGLRRNCNTFVGSVASAAGLKAPQSSFRLPSDYVGELQSLNGERKPSRKSRRA